MAYHPETGAQKFTNDWNQTVAWAKGEGIGDSAISAVYALDLTRQASGEYPMGRAERNLSILAAHNPNQVSSAPSDNPNPSNILGNVVSDAGKIATGLEGIFTGSFEKQLWHSTQATYEGIIHPATLEGSSPGGTMANWLNNTLLSYVPGFADIGTVLKADPNLSGSQGFTQLAKHPLLSLLDIVPGEGGAVERVAGKIGATELAARLAARGGDRSAFSEISRQIAQATAGGKPGVTLRGQLMSKLSVSDRIQNMLAQVGGTSWGVGPAISSLGEAYQAASALAVDQYTWLEDAPTEMLKNMSTEDKTAAQKILSTYRTHGGDAVRDAMKDPSVSPAVKDLVHAWIDGPARFATEEELFAGGIRPTKSLDGQPGMWAPDGGSARRVLAAGRLKRMVELRAVDSMGELEPLAAHTHELLAMLPQAVQQWRGALTTARQQVFDDPALQTPLTRPLAQGASFARKAGSLSKADQLHAVVGEGGLADMFEEQIQKNRDPDQVEALAKAMKSRLSSWGPKSVRAADHPALAELYRLADGFEKWAKEYQRNAKRIDHEIFGAEKSRGHFKTEQDAYRAQQRTMIRDRQKVAGANLLEKYRRSKSVAAGKLAQVVTQATEAVTWQHAIYEREANALEQRGTRAEIAEAVKQERIKKKAASDEAARRIKEARTAMKRNNDMAWKQYQVDRLKLTRDNEAELRRFDKRIAAEAQGMGEKLAEAVRAGNVIRQFHREVFDHPPDQYKNVYRALMERHMATSIESSTLARLTDQYLRNIDKMTQERLNQISSDPQVLTEYAMTYFDEVMNQPDLDPEVAADARDEMRKYGEDAREQLKILVGRGLRIPYIPSATSFDERLGRNSMAPIIGHGIPKPDMAKAKVWEFTPHKEDFALGINKAVVQTLQRDATIHLVEDTLRPMTLTRAQVGEFIAAVMRPEEREFGGNLPHEIAAQAQKLGLTAVNFDSMFGFKLPRWGNDEVYLPTAIVRSLEKMEKSRKDNLLKASNKVFRYSILGLSPRYTAHILFGGTMMLALRSSPYAITMIGDAARALRDGTIPHSIARHAVEEGFEEPVNMLQSQVGRDMAKMAIGEHMETRQGIKAAAAKPVHVIRALADINFRFTRYLRDLQASIAYLDGAAKYERAHGGKVEVEDPETGKMVQVSPERAVKEGMHHVQQVFGNLHRMSPFERQVAQTVMPFYGWQKHILGYVMSFPFDHPMRALVLSQLAYNSSNDVPLAYPIRLQLLMPLGSPDANGNTNALDIRSLDPFRDVANYGTLTGFFESLNPALAAPLSMAFGSQAVYGESDLYPNVTYNAFYGIQTASSGGSWVTALEQWVPQAGAVVSALQATSGLRSEWTTNRPAAIKSLLESMNIPFVTPPINLKQMAAKDEAARYEVASKAAYNAFSSGDFSGLAGYKTVPNPLNTAYEITPAQLQQLYQQAAQANPGVAPIESLLPPPTPYGW